MRLVWRLRDRVATCPAMLSAELDHTGEANRSRWAGGSPLDARSRGRLFREADSVDEIPQRGQDLQGVATGNLSRQREVDSNMLFHVADASGESVE